MRYKRLFILVSLLLVCLVSAYFLKSKNEVIEFTFEDNDTLVHKPLILYGINVDSLIIEEDYIHRNRPISTVLSGYSISPLMIDQMVKKAHGIFDFRKIRSGNRYKAFLTNDTVPQLKFFIYEHSPTEFLKIIFADSIFVEKGTREIELVSKTHSGTIEYSLWNTLVDGKANPQLANDLSDIYAWVIDFFALQKGDSFKIAYTEGFVDSISVGIISVDYAVFSHMGQPFYAIPFEQDSTQSFYDIDGKSLKKAFLKAPLRYSRISSGFSNSRMHPVLRIRRPHHGVDYAAPSGTPVMAIGDGIILSKGWDSKGGGNYVKIKHNGVYTTAYLHLKGFAKGISTGSFVKQGQVIGYVGKTGLATGPHLDFRFFQNGQAIDPLKVKAPPVLPVDEQYMAAFDSVKIEIINKLDQI